MPHPRSRSFLNIFTLLALLLSLLGSAMIVEPAYAGTINVTTVLDEFDTTGSGAGCSLREAIQTANTGADFGGCIGGSAGADTINIPAGTYTLSIPPTDSGLEHTNQDGDLDITSDLTIQGAGAASTIIQAGTVGYPEAGANGIDGIFQISYDSTGPQLVVNIYSVTVANGRKAGIGGAIVMYKASTLNIGDAVFSGNNVSSPGGAIFAWGGTIGITNSIFSDNRASWGGAIYIQSNGVLNITNSSFLNNLAYDINGGGALSISGTSTIVNSTFSNNSAPVHSGGGIYYSGSNLSLYNNTFTGNSAKWGGALKVEGTAYLYNNILADSVIPAGSNSVVDCHNYGTVYGNNNLIETDDRMYGCSTNMTGTILNVDPQLTGPVQDPGMPEPNVYFFEPALPSPVIEAGDPTACSAEPVLNQDQRGVVRPQGNICDIGSYELELTPGYTLIETNGSTDVIEGGVADTYSVILNDPPTNNVTITPTPNAQVTANPSSLIFTHDNWHTPQIVTVTGVSDVTTEGTHTGVIQHTVTTTDPVYSALSAPDLTVNVTEVILGLSPHPLDIGIVEISNSSYADVTITNNGVIDATIKSISVTSGNSDFWFEWGGCYDKLLVPTDTCQFRVFFAPTVVGLRTGQVTITSNGAPTMLDLKGEGAIPLFSVTPSPLDFGDQLIGTYPPKTVTITNTGKAGLRISWNDEVTAPFDIWNNDCAGKTLNYNESCTIALYFNPTVPGPQTGTLTIHSNAEPYTHTVSLLGNGIAPDISLSSTSLDFGNQLVDSTSAPKPVTITNTGNALLHIGVLTSNSGSFALSSNTCNDQVIPVGGTCTFSVTFAPSSMGLKGGEIAIPSDAGILPSDRKGETFLFPYDNVVLSGTGILQQSGFMTFSSNGTNDGMVRESSETSGSGNYTNATNDMIALGDDNLKRQYIGILDFDTSNLPNNAVITGAKLQVKVMLFTDGVYSKLGNLIADITNPFFGNFVTLQNVDFGSPALFKNVGTFTRSTAINQWITLRVNTTSLSAVNRTGHTQFRIRFTLDDSNDVIKHQIGILSGNYRSPSARPLLVVTYYVP
jgi:CSLREA domain-containing protein